MAAATIALASACAFSPEAIPPASDDLGSTDRDAGVFADASGADAAVSLPDAMPGDAPPLDPPRAVPDDPVTAEDQPIAFDPLANDEGEGLELVELAGTALGSLSRDPASGALVYAPATDRFGREAVRYTVRDRHGQTASSTITITVTAVNDAPRARAISARTPYETTADVILEGADVDGSTLAYAVVRGPRSGRVSVVQGDPPRVRYTPILGFHGRDTFLYRASDGALDSTTATVTVTVLPADWVVPAAELRRSVCVDGSAIAEPAADFPVLVTAPPGTFAGARSGGVDLAFHAPSMDGPSRLPHEIERWSVDGTSAIWVRFPRVETATRSCATVYYGVPFPPPPPDPRAVWSAGFGHVVHLGERAIDARTGAQLVAVGTATVGGAIALGQRFGSSTAIDLPPGGVDFAEGTVTAWIRADPALDLADDAFLFYATATSTGAGQGFGPGEMHLGLDASERLRWFARDRGDAHALGGSIGLDSGAWRFVAVTWARGDAAVLYLDGVELGRVAYEAGPRVASALVRLGAPYDPASRRFQGDADEVRVSTVARTAAWIELEYRMVADGQLVVLGPADDGS